MTVPIIDAVRTTIAAGLRDLNGASSDYAIAKTVLGIVEKLIESGANPYAEPPPL